MIQAGHKTVRITVGEWRLAKPLHATKIFSTICVHFQCLRIAFK